MIKTDPTLDKIFKEVGDENQIITTQVKEAYEIYMQLNMGKMRQWISVMIPNMGTFRVSRRKVLEKILGLFKSFRKKESGGEGITREYLIERLHVYLPVRQVANEHSPGRGVDYKIRVNKEKGVYFRTKDKIWQSSTEIRDTSDGAAGKSQNQQG